MGKAKTARRIATVAALFGVGALVVTLTPSVSGAKPLSGPTFSSKATAKAKQGKALHFTIKTKGNPVPTVSETNPLPPGVTFTPDDANGTALLTDPTPLAGSYTIDLQADQQCQHHPPDADPHRHVQAAPDPPRVRDHAREQRLLRHLWQPVG